MNQSVLVCYQEDHYKIKSTSSLTNITTGKLNLEVQIWPTSLAHQIFYLLLGMSTCSTCQPKQVQNHRLLVLCLLYRSPNILMDEVRQNGVHTRVRWLKWWLLDTWMIHSGEYIKVRKITFNTIVVIKRHPCRSMQITHF